MASKVRWLAEVHAMLSGTAESIVGNVAGLVQNCCCLSPRDEKGTRMSKSVEKQGGDAAVKNEVKSVGDGLAFRSEVKSVGDGLAFKDDVKSVGDGLSYQE
jgi:hypothetical protein